MKEFEQIGKQTPYVENANYIDELVSRATEKAMEENHYRAHSTHLRRWIATAAIILLLASVSIIYFSRKNQEAKNPQQVIVKQQRLNSPIDEFLDSLTTKEIMILAYYETEDIPEY